MIKVEGTHLEIQGAFPWVCAEAAGIICELYRDDKKIFHKVLDASLIRAFIIAGEDISPLEIEKTIPEYAAMEKEVLKSINLIRECIDHKLGGEHGKKNS